MPYNFVDNLLSTREQMLEYNHASEKARNKKVATKKLWKIRFSFRNICLCCQFFSYWNSASRGETKRRVSVAANRFV